MSQVNRNFAYLTDVDGFTVWEKLRVIRNFLTERRKALAIAELNQEKFEHKKSGMDIWELRETEIMNSDLGELVQDCRDEIDFLEKLESILIERAEQERIPGKSDREMYELNYPNEQRARTVHQAKSEMVAHGNISLDTASRMMKDPVLMNELVSLQLVQRSVAENLMALPKANGLELIEQKSNYLLGENNSLMLTKG